MMRFEDELYEAVSGIFPSTTVRSFSQALGMSDGYWSSITAQGLRVSNKALINLYEYLQVRHVLLDFEGSKSAGIRTVQRMIACEVVKRFADETESIAVDNDALMDRHGAQGFQQAADYGALPFIMLRG